MQALTLLAIMFFNCIQKQYEKIKKRYGIYKTVLRLKLFKFINADTSKRNRPITLKMVLFNFMILLIGN